MMRGNMWAMASASARAELVHVGTANRSEGGVCLSDQSDMPSSGTTSLIAKAGIWLY